jgi:TolB-like protein/class 3 adenylate cyclase/Flp pilus assembly protein TadD
MAAEVKKEIELEIAHVLFTDIVGYSKLPINQQRALVERLNEIVRGTDEYQAAERAGRLITIPTGDGITLVFYDSPETPAECALQISRALKKHPELELRMGVHSGPVSGVIDATGKANVAGAGINIAQRVMDCGDAGHILLSKHVAEDLEEYPHWQPHLHELGECEVKHGVRVSVVNLYTADLGNPAVPEKLKAARVAAAAQRKKAAFRWLSVGVGSLLAVLAVIGFLLFHYRRPVELPVPEKSIAVLPFENRSEDKANAYFTDGVQDEILTYLAKIADLKVISRTSVMQYKSGVARNMREIARQLGVANVVEGSVQRSGNRVRVNAQLVDARNDAHLWAQTYDRDLADVFAIQSEIAKAIADQLQAKLSPNEKARIDRMPTQNPDAYVLYIQAHYYANRPDMFRDASLKAEELFQQAIKLDPNFALAFAGLSEMESWFYRFDPVPARREKARLNANEALRLQPDLPEGHLALGFCYYYGDRDYERALSEFEIAKRDLPNEVEAYIAIGSIQRRQGRWAESNMNLEKSVALGPKDERALINLAVSYMAQRNFKTADQIFDRTIVAEPQSLTSRLNKAEVAIRWKGDVGFAENQLSLVPPGFDPDGFVTSEWVWVLTLQRKFSDALKAVQQFRGETLPYFNAAPCPKAFLEGWLYLYQGDKMKAQAAFEHARTLAEKLVREAPDDPTRHRQLGAILAGMGLKEDAINEGKKAVELLPESQDAFDGPQATAGLAEIYAWIGEHDKALRLIDHLLRIPSDMTVHVLKLDPVWDPLRGDPRLEQIVASFAPKQARK